MGASLIGALRVTLGIDTAAFEQGIGLAQKQLNAAGRNLQAVGGRIAGAGVAMTAGITAPFAALLSQAIPAAQESQQAIAQVNAALASMGPVAGRTSEQLQAAAGKLQDISNFDDDDILVKVTANMLTFGKVTGEVFDRAQLAAVNMSVRLKQDLQSSAIQLGKALNDPVQGLSALGKVGAVSKEWVASNKAMIAGLVASGDRARAQTIILGELEKQYAGAAKAQRDATPGADAAQAWRSFTEVVGAVAIKVLPPLSKALTGVLDAFNTLTPGMQTAAIAGFGLAAAFGPAAVVIGNLVSLAGKIAPAFAPIVAVIGEAGMGGAFAALGAAIAPIAGFILPVIAVVGGLAAAWALFGDKIGPVLGGLWEKVQAVLGPKLAALIDAAKEAFSALWNGPLGEMLRVVIDLVGDFLAACVEAWGDRLISLLSAAAQFITSTFGVIGDAIKFVSALLTGDFRGAWQALKDYVAHVAEAWIAVFNGLVPGIGDALKRLYIEVRTWLVQKLDAVWKWVVEKIDRVKKAFHDLYDAVVGHSYVPDMVKEVGEHIGKLGELMVDPVEEATGKASRSFADMAQSIEGALDAIVQSIRKGDWIGALGGVLDLIGQVMGGRSAGGGLGGAGLAGGGLAGGGLSGLAGVLQNAGALFGFRVPLPGFATGGSFEVGGVAGVDRNLIAFRASRGEMVNVTRGGNDNGRHGATGLGGGVTINFQGPVSNAAEVRRSAAQAGAHLARQLAMGQRGI